MKTRKLLSLLMALALCFGLLAIAPLTASATGNDYSINGDAGNMWAAASGAISLANGDTMTILSGAATDAGVVAINIAAGADVTITGNSTMITNLYISAAAGATVRIENLKITAPTGPTQYTYNSSAGGVIILTGDNEFDSGSTTCLNGATEVTINSSSAGALILDGHNYQAINTQTVNITGDAQVTATSAGSATVHAEAALNIAQNASLIVNNTGTTGDGIMGGNGTLVITNNGSLTAAGGTLGLVIDPSSLGTASVVMSPGATTTLTNNRTSDETHAFSMSPSGAGTWQLSGGAVFSGTDTATSDPANITILAGGSGTITLVAPVCEIVGGSQYTSLDDALADVPTGGATPTTIKLLANIDYPATLWIDNKNITFDPSSFVLSITDLTGDGLGANDGATVVFPGNITVGDGGYGIDAEGGSTVTVTGDVTAGNSSGGSDVIGIFADGSTVIVTGDITVGNNVSNGAKGVDAENGSTVSVTGKVTAGDNAIGVNAGLHATVNVTGNIIVGAGSDGIDAIGSGSTVTVGGNVTSGGFGAYADTGGQITINGVMTATGWYVDLNGFEYDQATGIHTPTTLTGYLTYTDGTSTVWVKAPSSGGVPSGGGGATTSYTVTFNTNGGSAVASQSVQSGKTATQPAARRRTATRSRAGTATRR